MKREVRGPWARLLVGLLLPLVLGGGPDPAMSQAPGPSSWDTQGGAGARFLRLGVEQGLAHSTVWAVQQDAEGFLWVATEAAVQRFDGYRFTTFLHDPEDPSSLSSSEVMAMALDTRGQLWLATRQHGLNRYDPEEQSFVRYHGPGSPASGPTPVSVQNDLFEDSRGALWAAGSDGLFRLDAERREFTRIALPSPEPTPPDGEGEASGEPEPIALAESPPGILWIGTSAGLLRWPIDGSEPTWFRDWFEPGGGTPATAVPSLWADDEGWLWQGSFAGELHRRRTTDADLGLDTSFEVQLPGWPSSIIDWEGWLWVATYGAGMVRVDPRSGDSRVFHHDGLDPASLASDRVVSLTTDRSGSLWTTTREGLHQLHRDRRRFRVWTHLGESAALGGGVVLGLEEDRRGNLWVSGDGWVRVFEKDGGTSAVIGPATANGEPIDQIEEILEDRQGRLWFADEEGLLYLDPPGRDLYRVEGLLGTDLRAMAERADGNLWLAGNDLLLFDPVTFEILETRPVGDFSYAVLEDGEGRVWVGTNLGLERFDPGASEPFSYRHDPENPRGLGSHSVGALLVDRQDRLWVGQVGGGLARYEPANDGFVRYRTADGLPHDNVVSLLEDDHGKLWVGTHGGLARFDPESETFQRFDTSDGLVSNAFLIGPSLVARSGTLLLGAAGGLHAWDPDDFESAAPAAPVVITAVAVDGDPIELAADELLDLRPRQKAVTFDFAALDFSNPGRVRYRHRLRGFDSWSELDSLHRRARYTNLDPGDYVFEVQATDAAGRWGDDTAARALRVHPSPWRSWWALSLYALGLGLLVLMQHRSQQRKLRRQEQAAERERGMAERERAVNRRLRAVDKLKDEFLASTSHELRTPLFGITGLAESLLGGAGGELGPAVRENLELIVASGRRLGHLVDDILDFSKMRHESLQLSQQAIDLRPLVEVVLTLTRPLVGDKPLELINRVPRDLPPVSADEDRLMQIFHNLVGNAVKFTDRGQVVVLAERRDGRIELQVEDTGPGVPEAERERIFEAFTQAEGTAERVARGTGLGLTLTRQLVELHGGTLAVRAATGGGSVFYFDLAVARDVVPATSTSQRLADLAAVHPDAVPRDAKVGEGVGLVPQDPGARAPADGPSSTVSAEATVGSGDPIAAEHRPAHILVADDEPVNRRVLAQYLESGGYTVSTAANGAEAVRQVARRCPDLVLLDVMMPRKSGYEVCRELRETHSLEELPVLFLTAKSQPTDLVVGLSAGANDYLSKPIGKNALLARVRTHLDLLSVHRRLSQVLEERTEQVEERTRLLSEREALIEELEARHTELARFNYTVSHDLRNPLVTIRNFLGSLRSGLREGRREHFEEDLGRLDRAANDMQRLLEDLDKFSRAGRPQGTLQPVELGSLVAGVRRALETEGTSGVLFEVADDLPAVLADRGRLAEVFRQLVDNAIRFSDRDAEAKIEIGARCEGDEVEIWVRDHGVGIEAPYQERIFELFERLDPENAQGTGVGLALARRIVESLGGRIWVESEGLGRGSTFRLTLRGAFVSKEPGADEGPTG